MAEISTETWEDILLSVKEKSCVPDISFRTWLQPLKVHDVKNNTVVILIPMGKMGIDYISKKYLSFLKAAVTEITGTEYEIEFILPKTRN